MLGSLIMKILRTAMKTALLAAVVLSTQTVSASDIDLLETLFQNGVINKAQFDKLSQKAIAKEEEVKETQSSDWASRIKVAGDVRVRQEFRDSDDKGVEKSRQRIRARIGIEAKVNDEIDAAIRLATGNVGGNTSTNQDLDSGFGAKDINLDRAYFDWHPDFAKGAHLVAGKMKQQWYRVTDNIWDSDVNPEGVLIKYGRTLGGANLKATAGYFIVDAENLGKDSFSDDMNMYHYGLSGDMKMTDAVKASLGMNSYLYNGTEGKYDFTAKTGNTATDYKLYEVAGKVDFDTGVFPIKLYGNYVVNAADMGNSQLDDQDTAWLMGVATKWHKFKLDYNYRDTQANAVVDIFNDSDFNDGDTSSRGHKIKLGYSISKNFSAGLAYFSATEYGAVAKNSGHNDRDTLQIDVKAKF